MKTKKETFQFYALFTISSYIVWYLCVATAARGPGPASIGMAIALLISLIEFFIYVYWHEDRRLFYTTIIVMISAGFIVDTCALLFNVITFSANFFSPFAPPWMIILWFNFSMCCHVLMRQHYRRSIAIAILAFIGIFIAYSAGALLGAAQLHYGVYSLLYFAGIWAGLMPTLFLLFDHLAQIDPSQKNNKMMLKNQ